MSANGRRGLTGRGAWPHYVALWARRYPLAPRYVAPAQPLSTVADDGVRLAGWRIPGPADARCSVVVAHGLSNWSRTPGIHSFASRLALRAHVVVLDLRGHGRSAGVCTLGLREPLDVKAAVALAREAADLPVVTVGASMGGSAALLSAAQHGGVAGVVAVSAPAWWGAYDRPGSERLLRWASSASRRLVLHGLTRTRVTARCEPVPDSRELAPLIAPAFVVVAHDPEDHYFGPEHPEAIYEWCVEPKELWWYEGLGHGTDLLTDELADRILDHAESRLS